MKSEFLRFSKTDLTLITLLVLVLSLSLGYYLGTHHNFETKAITKHYD